MSKRHFLRGTASKPFGLGLFLCIALAPVTLSAQTAHIRGLLLEADQSRPISGAGVYLISASNGTVAAVLSNANGRFQFNVGEAGSYHIRIERIGYETEQTQPFDLAPGQVVTPELTLRVRPIELEAIEVRTERRCSIDAGSADALATIWREARKALTASFLSAGDTTVTHVVELYERELDGNLRIRSGQADTLAVGTGHGFQFIGEEELEGVGWGRIEDGVITRYYGPSPEALLSGWFQSTHCFDLIESPEDHPDELGLAFLSIEDLVPVGIDGVLWINRATWHLRSIDFRFTSPKEMERAEHQGGTITLGTHPTGSWYVPSWFIRSPILGGSTGRRITIGRGGRSLPRRRVVGYRERGGSVLGSS